MSNSRATAPDSLRAWIVSCAAFLACSIAHGFLYTFGVFLKPMGSGLAASHAVMAILFSFMSVLFYLLTPVAGELADHIGARKVMLAGALLFAVGLVGTARAGSYLVALPSLGIGVGGTLACVYVPAIAAVGEWFKKYRDLALGIALSGIGVGTLVAAPLNAWLIRAYGWRSTLMILGISGGLLLLVSAVLMFRPPVKVEGTKGGRAVWAKVRTPQFWLVYLSRMFTAIPVFIAMIYLPALAEKEDVGSVSAAALVGYIGGASIVSRLGLNALAEKLGATLLFQFSCVCIGAACVLWIFAYSYLTLVFFVVVLGIAYGGVASLTPAVAIEIFGLENIGELLGLLLTSFGVAAAIGPPAAGVLVDRSHKYRYIVWLALAASVLGLISGLALSKFRPVPKPESTEQAVA